MILDDIHRFTVSTIDFYQTCRWTEPMYCKIVSVNMLLIDASVFYDKDISNGDIVDAANASRENAVPIAAAVTLTNAFVSIRTVLVTIDWYWKI